MNLLIHAYFWMILSILAYQFDQRLSASFLIPSLLAFVACMNFTIENIELKNVKTRYINLFDALIYLFVSAIFIGVAAYFNREWQFATAILLLFSVFLGIFAIWIACAKFIQVWMDGKDKLPNINKWNDFLKKENRTKGDLPARLILLLSIIFPMVYLAYWLWRM